MKMQMEMDMEIHQYRKLYVTNLHDTLLIILTVMIHRVSEQVSINEYLKYQVIILIKTVIVQKYVMLMQMMMVGDLQQHLIH